MADVEAAKQRVAAAQKKLADFEAGHDDYIAARKPASTFTSPDWETNAEKLYQTVRDRLQTDTEQAQASLDKAQPPEKTATPQTPAQANASQSTADKNNADTARQAQLDKERTANQAKGLGYVTNAEAATLGLAQQKGDVQQGQLDLANQKLGLQAYEQQQRDLVAQGKLDALQAATNVKDAYYQALNANRGQENAETKRHDLEQEAEARASNAQAQRNTMVTQANSRAQDATSTLNNSVSSMNDAAKNGAFAAGDVAGLQIKALPEIAAANGGAPVALPFLAPTAGGGGGTPDSPVTPDQLNQVQALIKGGLPPQAAAQLVANAHGVNLSGTSSGGPPPSYGPQNSPMPPFQPPLAQAA